ncbi:MAG: hypothetical protein JSW19_02260, partial [Candidatus Bathyarchaeota archaeon]
EVDVSIAGNFKIEIDGLADIAASHISVLGQNFTYLDVGIQVVYLSLNGTSINLSELNPFFVDAINLYDESDNLLDSLNSLLLSREYFYWDFERSHPFASLTGTIYDSGLDTDDDGTFDFLQVGVEVDVSIAGNFKIEIDGLGDLSNLYISVLGQNFTYLDVGIQVVYLSLDGASIYVSELNPFSVSDINLYDENDNELDSSFDVSLSREYFYTEFALPRPEIEFNEIKREITLDQWGSIHIRNAFSITSIGNSTSIVKVGFPEGAYDFAARDGMGRIETLTENETVTVNLRETLHTNETCKFYLSHSIPWEKYVSQQDGLNYNLNLTLFERFNWTIGKLTVSITLPKGAEFQSSSPLSPSSIERGVFQETITFAFFNVTPFENLNSDITYEYLVFWASFYPTLWIGVLIIIASAIAFFWRAPKSPTVPMVPVPPEDLRSYTKAYEGKTRILSELESMERKLRRGKIPRRRYKVRKKMLGGRLSTISRDLSVLQRKIGAAGPKYANIMRQIEVAETTLEGMEKDIRRVEARYRRGEISKGAYGKLLDEYNRRMERARTTIDGVLLRLREEIR